MELQEFIVALDSEIRTHLNAPDDAFGFLEDSDYERLHQAGVCIQKTGRECADSLIKSGWCY